MSNLKIRSYAVLAAGARMANPSAGYDDKGYTSRWRDNLMPGLPLAEIVQDLAAGAGKELGGKLAAAHSSMALAVNFMGPWRTDPARLVLDRFYFERVRFEVQCPTSLRGTPPHLDVLAEGGNDVVAVESKCTEWMTAEKSQFSTSYDKLAQRWQGSPWFSFIAKARRQPNQYAHLDCAQLVKHALGLKHSYPNRRVTLLYLFWEPLNASKWRECERHRHEINDLVSFVKGDDVALTSLSYAELWRMWRDQYMTQSHETYLANRYLADVE